MLQYKDKRMDIKFKIKIIVILSLISIIFISFSSLKKEQNLFDLHPELQPTESLKQNYKDAYKLCQNKNFRVPAEFESCTWQYVENKSQEDFRILESIRNYCLSNSECEFDRRNCVNEIIE